MTLTAAQTAVLARLKELCPDGETTTDLLRAFHAGTIRALYSKGVLKNRDWRPNGRTVVDFA